MKARNKLHLERLESVARQRRRLDFGHISSEELSRAKPIIRAALDSGNTDAMLLALKASAPQVYKAILGQITE